MIRIGKILGTHGLNGQLVLQHVLPDNDWVHVGEALFVEVRKESAIPYFIKDFKIMNAKEVLITLEDVTSMDEAKPLQNKTVFVKDEVVQTTSDDSPLAWIGYMVQDKTAGDLSTLNDVYQSAHQWIGQLEMDNKEVLLPLIPEFIESVDTEGKLVVMNLPDGLLEVYLS